MFFLAFFLWRFAQSNFEDAKQTTRDAWHQQQQQQQQQKQTAATVAIGCFIKADAG